MISESEMLLAAYVLATGLDAALIIFCYRGLLKNRQAADAWIYPLLVALYWLAYLFSSYHNEPPLDELSLEKCLYSGLWFALLPVMSIFLINFYRKPQSAGGASSRESVSRKTLSFFWSYVYGNLPFMFLGYLMAPRFEASHSGFPVKVIYAYVILLNLLSPCFLLCRLAYVTVKKTVIYTMEHPNPDKVKRRLGAAAGIFLCAWIFFPNYLVLPNLLDYYFLYPFFKNWGNLSMVSSDARMSIGRRGSLYFLKLGLQSPDPYVAKDFIMACQEINVSRPYSQDSHDLLIYMYHYLKNNEYPQDPYIREPCRGDIFYFLLGRESDFPYTREEKVAILDIYHNIAQSSPPKDEYDIGGEKERMYRRLGDKPWFIHNNPDL